MYFLVLHITEPSTEVSAPPSRYISHHGPPGVRRRHVEQHASVWLHLPQSNGTGGFCRSEICQQVGLPLPRLRHYLHCVHLRRSDQVHDSPTRISVSHISSSSISISNRSLIWISIVTQCSEFEEVWSLKNNLFFCFSSCCSRICMLGNRTLVRDRFDVCAKTIVMGNMTVTSQLSQRFCVSGNTTSSQCDDYFLHNNLTEVPGIPGLGSGVIRGRAPTCNMAKSFGMFLLITYFCTFCFCHCYRYSTLRGHCC